MYTEFYELKEAPFNSTLDPKFFYASPQHEEALASLVYAVQEHKGIVVLTGDVGSGKTFMGQLLINKLGNSVETAALTNSHLSGNDLLSGLCREFQIEHDPSRGTMDTLAAIEEHLLALHARERTALLILDDAHSLDDRSFEQLRLIANLEVASGKLLQIVLFGQKDLHQRLQRPSAKTLRQRVFRHFHISLLSRDTTEQYITHRLKSAGMNEPHIFDDDALDLIHQFSSGVPRLINNLCDNILLSAYTDGIKLIDRERVNLVIDEMVSDNEHEQPDPFHAKSDEIDHAISEITSQYVESLESQVSQLENARVETDQRIHELHRLSSKLQAQELKFSEHQGTIDAKIRDLHRLTVVLQEQENSLSAREKQLSLRLETLNQLSDRLDGQEKKLTEREAQIAQQLRWSQQLSSQLVEQDQQLSDRASFIEKKLTTRQVSFDRELNECKRLINQKWQDMKNLVEQYEGKAIERAKQFASMEQRIRWFEQIKPKLDEQETRLSVIQENAKQATVEMVRTEKEMRDKTRFNHKVIANKVEQSLQKLVDKSQKVRRDIDQEATQLSQLIEQSKVLLTQPEEIMSKAAQQMQQVERMTQIVQKASDVLQQNVKQSLEASSKITQKGAVTCDRLEGLKTESERSFERIVADAKKQFEKMQEESAVSCGRIQAETKSALEEMSERSDKIFKLKDILKEVYNRSAHLETQLRSNLSAAERRQQEILQTVAQRGDEQASRLDALLVDVAKRQDEMMRNLLEQARAQETRMQSRLVEVGKQQQALIEQAVEQAKKQEASLGDQFQAIESRHGEVLDSLADQSKQQLRYLQDQWAEVDSKYKSLSNELVRLNDEQYGAFKAQSDVQIKRLHEEINTAIAQCNEIQQQFSRQGDVQISQFKNELINAQGQYEEFMRKVSEQSQQCMETFQQQIEESQRILSKTLKRVEQLRTSSDQPARLIKELRSVGSATERNLHDGQVRLAELRTMIDKANKARTSIEALINATRRVADGSRIPAAKEGGFESAHPSMPLRRPDVLNKKIESLTEAIRKVRGGSDGGSESPLSSVPVDDVVEAGES